MCSIVCVCVVCSVCVCVHACAYACVCMHARTRVCVCACVRVYACVRAYACVRVRVLYKKMSKTTDRIVNNRKCSNNFLHFILFTQNT